MTNKKIYTDAVRNVGKILIEQYSINEEISCGINGPYDDPETRVRNLSHLAIITSIEILIFQSKHYLPILEEMGSDLLAQIGPDGLYCMREKKGKDRCNGIIGHSWVLEAYFYLFKVTKDKIYLNEMVRIIKLHKFQPAIGLWAKPNLSNKDSDIDFTLNHQLWYAATVSEINQILKDKDLGIEIETFMDKLSTNFGTSKYGKIMHNIYKRKNKVSNLKHTIKKLIDLSKEGIKCSSMAYKEEGYHLFNIMALARIYRLKPETHFFETTEFKRALKYLNSEKFLQGLMDSNVETDQSLHNNITDPGEKDINIYGYVYNVPGFEIMYVYEAFNNMIDEKICQECLKKQFELTYDEKIGMFGNKCHDKNTINYRTYEYYRYLEIS